MSRTQRRHSLRALLLVGVRLVALVLASVGLLALGLAGSFVLAGRGAQVHALGLGTTDRRVIAATAAVGLIAIVAHCILWVLWGQNREQLRYLEARDQGLAARALSVQRQLNRRPSDAPLPNVRLDDVKSRLASIIDKCRALNASRRYWFAPGRGPRQRRGIALAFAAFATGLTCAPFAAISPDTPATHATPWLGLVSVCTLGAALVTCRALLVGQPLIGGRRQSLEWPVATEDAEHGASWSPVYVVLLVLVLAPFYVVAAPHDPASSLEGVGVALTTVGGLSGSRNLLRHRAVGLSEAWWEERLLVHQQRVCALAMWCVPRLHLALSVCAALLAAVGLAVVHLDPVAFVDLLIGSCSLAGLAAILGPACEARPGTGDAMRRIGALLDALDDPRHRASALTTVAPALGLAVLYIAR